MADFTFAPLTPVSFLDRAAASFAERVAVVDGETRLTYADFGVRCNRLVSALADSGVDDGDRVGALCANSHVLLEMHYGVPARGAVLVAVNTRLGSEEARHILQHSGAKLLVATVEYTELANVLAAELDIPLFLAGGDRDTYERWLDREASPADRVPVDERDLLAINYTSGTTGWPKGVMYHHRGAYLQAVAMAYHADLGPGSSYLWTLPMFHCNGWCFTWAVTAAGGTHVCLRRIDPAEIWRLLRQERITNFSAAPTVLTMIAEDPASGILDRRVHVDTGGSPPSPTLLARLDARGFDVTHLYGLTETFGPIAVNVWQPQWDEEDAASAARRRSRQGIANIVARPLRVLDRSTGTDVPADGESIGEIVASGNDLMLGYYRDEAATAAATRNGCFLTGDLGVMHPDGYVEIRDRSKDIIISGGENIASVEVERTIDSHPDVVESAVVAAPHPKWGEVPVAFVTRRSGSTVSEADLVGFLRERLAGFKIPEKIIFTDLPKTSTGKIQKSVLRERVAT